MLGTSLSKRLTSLLILLDGMEYQRRSMTREGISHSHTLFFDTFSYALVESNVTKTTKVSDEEWRVSSNDRGPKQRILQKALEKAGTKDHPDWLHKRFRLIPASPIEKTPEPSVREPSLLDVLWHYYLFVNYHLASCPTSLCPYRSLDAPRRPVPLCN